MHCVKMEALIWAFVAHLVGVHNDPVESIKSINRTESNRFLWFSWSCSSARFVKFIKVIYLVHFRFKVNQP